MTQEHPFEQFLKVFVPQVARKTRQLNKALWLLETTGSRDASDLKAELDAEVRMLYSDRNTYKKLLEWDQDTALIDPLLKRQLNVLMRTFKPNLIPQELLEEIVQKEAALAQSYANFRPQFEEKPISENEILEILKNEKNPARRQKVWEASKEIGGVLAPRILELVKLRNLSAQSVGYSDYFQMQLDLQEVSGSFLKNIFDEFALRSDAAYAEMLKEAQAEQSQRFNVSVKDLGPWAWSDPFCQEDPFDRHDLDSLVQGIDIPSVCRDFYHRMSIDVQPVLQQSDLYERPGKNQHAFCINIDRENDVRTLNNVKSTIKWLETVLHELGHAIYDLGFDPKLPWLLREPPHMITTEAMALIAGRQAYRSDALLGLIGRPEKKADLSLKRRQLIFSRWVLVMTFFESELYRNPQQDLNDLWWHAVEKYQKISRPQGREGKNDWAAKYHIALAPVYYFSYLLGEMFASAIEEALVQETGSRNLDAKEAGLFLQKKLFHLGNRLCWSDLVQHVIGKPLASDAWISQFAT